MDPSNKISNSGVNERLSNNSNNAPQFSVYSMDSCTRLPKISLPSFNGGIYSWIFFHDRFLVVVDQRPNLSNIDKIYYLSVICLLGRLKDEVLDAVRGKQTLVIITTYCVVNFAGSLSTSFSR